MRAVNETEFRVLRCKTPARLRLAVDERKNLGEPIRREHDLPALRSGNRTAEDQDDIRTDFRSIERHLALLRQRFANETVVAFVGNGNLLANFSFCAFSENQLYHLAEEPVFKKRYFAIVNWKDGRVSVEEIFFCHEHNHMDITRRDNGALQDISHDVDSLTTGQPLIFRGQAVSIAEHAEEWYDLRHLASPLCIGINGTTLFVPTSQLARGLIRKALTQPVHVSLETRVDGRTVLPLSTKGWLEMAKHNPTALEPAAQWLRSHSLLKEGEDIRQADNLIRVSQEIESLLEKSLEKAGYRFVDDSRALTEGECRFINGHIEVFFKKAVYPHNVFCRWADGSWGFVQFPGLSGRTGTTLPNAQQILRDELDVQDAVLLDNGGDVRLHFRGSYIIRPSEDREKMRSILAVMLPSGCNAWDAVSVC